MIRLFLADDMPAVREVIRSCLQEASDRFQVVGEAGDGCAALASIEALLPDVIILDVDMPGMNGLEVVRALRTRGMEQPVILCSSWEGSDALDLPRGVTHRLQKPFRFESLTAAVEGAADAVEGRGLAYEVGRPGPAGTVVGQGLAYEVGRPGPAGTLVAPERLMNKD